MHLTNIVVRLISEVRGGGASRDTSPRDVSPRVSVLSSSPALQQISRNYGGGKHAVQGETAVGPAGDELFPFYTKPESSL